MSSCVSAAASSRGWLAGAILLVTLAQTREAIADPQWQARGSLGPARMAQARAALLATPHRAGLAARAVRTLPAADRARLAGDLCRAPSGYAPVAACAELRAAMGDPERALAAFRAALVLRPQSTPAALGLARALTATGARAEAIDAFEHAAQLAEAERDTSRQATALREAARTASAAGDPSRALDLDLRRIERAPSPHVAQAVRDALALGRALRLAGRSPEAVATLDRAARLPDARGATRIAIAREASHAREAAGDLAGAIAAAREAWAAARSDRELGQRIVDRADRAGDAVTATKVFGELVAQAPWDGDLAASFVERQMRRGAPDAGDAFDATMRRHARDARALARLADAASVAGDGERAFAAWDALLTLDRRSERAIIALGELHLQRGRRELARRTWDLLLVAVRPPARAHAQLAELLVEHGTADAAADHAARALTLAPKDPQILRMVASVHERRRDRSRAIAAWTSVVAHAPAGAPGAALRREARSHLGALYADDGRARLESEIVAAHGRLRMQPRDFEITLFIADLERRLGRPDRAAQALAEAADEAPGAGEIVWPLVRMLLGSRQLGEAARRLDALARAAPEQAARAQLELAELALARRDPGAALLAAQRAEHADASVDVRLHVAGVHERAGDVAGALAGYAALLPIDSSGRAAIAHARTLVASGAPERALAALDGALARAGTSDLRVDLVRAAVPLAAALGATHALAIRFATRVDPRHQPERAELLLLLEATVPALHARAADGDARARGELAAIGAAASRPLVAALALPDTGANSALVALVTQLGRTEAVAPLAALATVRADGADGRADLRTRERARLDTQVAAALGCLARADARPIAAEALRTLTRSPERAARAAAWWALGHVGDERDVAQAEAATRESDAGVAAMAHLTLARLRTGPGTDAARVVRDPRALALVRAAAALAAGPRANAGTRAALVAALGSPDPVVADAAAAALAAAGDPAAVGPLMERALLSPARVDALRATRALARFGEPMPDDRVGATDGFSPEGIVARLAGAVATDGSVSPFDEYADAAHQVLAASLAETGPRRRAALLAIAGAARSKAPAWVDRLPPAIVGSVLAARDDPSPSVRFAAARAAAACGRPPEPAHLAAMIPIAANGTADPEAGPVAIAIEMDRLTEAALKSGADPAALVRAAEKASRFSDPRARRLAVRMVAKTGRAGRAALTRARQDPDPLVAAEARAVTSPE